MVRMPRTRLGLAVGALLSATAIWGATYVVIKGALADLGPFTIITSRFALGWVLLWALARRRGYRPSMSLDPRFLVFGLSGIVLHNGLETVGLVYTSAASAALVIGSAPAVTAGMSVLFLKERLGRLQTTGVALSVAGVALISFAADGSASSNPIIGNLLVFAGVVAWGVYTVQGKRLTAGYSGLVATAAGAGGALLFLVPLSVGEMVFRGLPHFTTQSLLLIAYLGLLASAAAYALWNFALEKVDASVAAPFINLVPVLGLTLAIIVGESVAMLQIVGGATVGVGVWLSTRNRKSIAHRAEESRNGALSLETS